MDQKDNSQESGLEESLVKLTTKEDSVPRIDITLRNLVQQGFTLEQIIKSALEIQEQEIIAVAPSKDKSTISHSKSLSSELDTKEISFPPPPINPTQRGKSESPTSDRETDYFERKDISGGTSGGGDHTIPDSAIKESVRIIIEDTSPGQIVDKLNNLSNALGLGNACPPERKLQQEESLAMAKNKRDERKILTRRLRGAQLIKQDVDSLEETIRSDINGISDIFNISIKPNIEEALGTEKSSDALRRSKELLDLTGNMNSQELEGMREAIHEKWEKEPIRQELLPITDSFLKLLDQRKAAIHPRSRVAEQRNLRKEKVLTLVNNFENFVDSNEYDKEWIKKRSGENLSEYKLRVLEEIENIQREKGAPFIKEKFAYEDATEIKKDIEYYNRVDAEGTKVNMAMRGLRAFNKLLEISDEPDSGKKEKLIKDFKDNSDLISGLIGTKVNPTFEITYEKTKSSGAIEKVKIDKRYITGTSHDYRLWNVKSDPDLLGYMCQRAGMLFDKAIDFERKLLLASELEDPGQLESEQINLDLRQLDSLYVTSAETMVFMFRSFGGFSNLSSEDQTKIKLSFTSNIIENQGWNKIPVGRSYLDGETLLNKSILKMGGKEEYLMKKEEEEKETQTQELRGRHKHRHQAGSISSSKPKDGRGTK